jgi:hypothetical protein
LNTTWFIAGFVDAEGSVGVVFYTESSRWNVSRPFLSFSNNDHHLMKGMARFMEAYHGRLDISKKGGTGTSKNGSIRAKDQWALIFSRRQEIRKLLDSLPLHHLEKVAKSVLVKRVLKGQDWTSAKDQYAQPKKEIKLGVNQLSETARLRMNRGL